MDVSNLFKASVKSVSLRNKDLGSPVAIPTTNILKKPKKKTPFVIKAQSVVSQIAKLHELLVENNEAYLNFSNHLSSSKHMSDEKRDQIDVGSQNIIATCSQLIKELRRELLHSEASQQQLEHQEIMLFLIEEYLKKVCKIYSEQKAIRVKRAMEVRKIAKFASDVKPLAPEVREKLSEKVKIKVYFWNI